MRGVGGGEAFIYVRKSSLSIKTCSPIKGGVDISLIGSVKKMQVADVCNRNKRKLESIFIIELIKV